MYNTEVIKLKEYTGTIPSCSTRNLNVYKVTTNLYQVRARTTGKLVALLSKAVTGERKGWRWGLYSLPNHTLVCRSHKLKRLINDLEILL